MYSDIASAYAVNAKRPDFEAALDDLRAGRIDGIAVWKVDRLVRRVSQFRRVLDTLESSGGRLVTVQDPAGAGNQGWPSNSWRSTTSWFMPCLRAVET